MSAASRADDGWVVLSLVGSYGDTGRRRLDILSLASAEDGPGQIGMVVDMTGLAELNSVVISWLLNTKVRLESDGRQLRLAGASPKHFSVLAMGGLTDTFTVYPDVDTARSI